MFFKNATSAQRCKILAAFNADEESAKKNVQQLVRWMERQPHLPNVKDENILLNMLFMAKNDLEAAKAQVERYYTARSTMPNVFAHRDPTEAWFKLQINTIAFVPMPELTSEGTRVMLYTVFAHEPNAPLPTVDEIVKGCQMVVDVLMKEDLNAGAIMLFDAEHVTARVAEILMKATPAFFPMIMKVLECPAVKIIYVNTPEPFLPVIDLFKSMLPPEMLAMITMWKKTRKDLPEILPKACLPSEYGGDLKPFLEIRDDFHKYMRGFREWFQAEEKVRADLTKSTGRAI